MKLNAFFAKMLQMSFFVICEAFGKVYFGSLNETANSQKSIKK